MSDFTPIPGVWYRDENQRELLYVPAPPDVIVDEIDEWYYRAGMSLEPGYPEGALVEVYNPHPPTRTEYRYAYEDEERTLRYRYFSSREEVERDRRDHRKYIGYAWPHWSEEEKDRYAAQRKYETRQVTETEWVEVDEKETGNG